jgi:hypothetical protein
MIAQEIACAHQTRCARVVFRDNRGSTSPSRRKSLKASRFQNFVQDRILDLTWEWGAPISLSLFDIVNRCSGRGAEIASHPSGVIRKPREGCARPAAKVHQTFAQSARLFRPVAYAPGVRSSNHATGMICRNFAPPLLIP